MKRATLLAILFSCAAFAADWPGWRGPNRTGISKEKGLLASWPKAGPKLLWTLDEAGIGYGGPAVVGDRLYLLGGDERNEQLHAIDVKTGKKAWTAEVGAFYDNDWGGGPRSTPTVDGDRVYALGGQGVVVCVAAGSGKKLWSKDLRRDLSGGIPNWGYSESPLIDGDRLICTPGGRQGTLAALDKKTG
jgi:outer membrane protein assembly factor BamB